MEVFGMQTSRDLGKIAFKDGFEMQLAKQTGMNYV